MSEIKPGDFADEPQRPEAIAGSDGHRYSARSVLQDPPEGEIILEPTGPDDGDGSPDGPWDDRADAVMKSMVPSKFLRPYLSEGHQSNSPAVLGHYGVTPQPGGMGMRPGGDAHVVEPQQADRPYLRQGHADPSPDDRAPNNPVPPGSPAASVYATAEHAFTANRQAERTTHLLPSACITSSPSSHGHMQMPADVRASEVPSDVVVSASRAAPGEAR